MWLKHFTVDDFDFNTKDLSHQRQAFSINPRLTHIFTSHVQLTSRFLQIAHIFTIHKTKIYTISYSLQKMFHHKKDIYYLANICKTHMDFIQLNKTDW